MGHLDDDIDALIDDVTVDAYNEDEQLWSFRQAFEDLAHLPFRATVVGADVTVTGIDFDGDVRRGLVAMCHRAGESYTVSLIDITPAGPLPLETSQLIDAYRRWAGATPLHAHAADAPSATPWVYPRFGVSDIDLEIPLELAPRASGIRRPSTGASPEIRSTRCARPRSRPADDRTSRWSR